MVISYTSLLGAGNFGGGASLQLDFRSAARRRGRQQRSRHDQSGSPVADSRRVPQITRRNDLRIDMK